MARQPKKEQLRLRFSTSIADRMLIFFAEVVLSFASCFSA